MNNDNVIVFAIIVFGIVFAVMLSLHVATNCNQKITGTEQNQNISIENPKKKQRLEIMSYVIINGIVMPVYEWVDEK